MSENNPSPKTKRKPKAKIYAPSESANLSVLATQLVDKINILVQDLVDMALTASTTKCNCEVCKMIREDTPMIKDLLRAAKQLARARRGR